jgi:hypothetical protein
MRQLGPPKLVVVHRDDHWCDGELRLEARPEGLRGYVRYAVSPGLRHLEGVTAERVRHST